MLRHASAGNTHVGSHRYSSHHVLPCTPGPRAIRAYYVSNRRAARCRAVQAFQHAGLHSPQAGRAAAATSKSPSPHTPCRLAFPFFTEPLTEETLSQLARGLHIQDSPENLCERMALGRAVAGIQAACREMHHAGQLAWSVEGVLRSGMVSGGTGVTGGHDHELILLINSHLPMQQLRASAEQDLQRIMSHADFIVTHSRGNWVELKVPFTDSRGRWASTCMDVLLVPASMARAGSRNIVSWIPHVGHFGGSGGMAGQHAEASRIGASSTMHGAAAGQHADLHAQTVPLSMMSMSSAWDAQDGLQQRMGHGSTDGSIDSTMQPQHHAEDMHAEVPVAAGSKQRASECKGAVLHSLEELPEVVIDAARLLKAYYKHRLAFTWHGQKIRGLYYTLESAVVQASEQLCLSQPVEAQHEDAAESAAGAVTNSMGGLTDTYARMHADMDANPCGGIKQILLHALQLLLASSSGNSTSSSVAAAGGGNSLGHTTQSLLASDSAARQAVDAIAHHGLTALSSDNATVQDLFG